MFENPREDIANMVDETVERILATEDEGSRKILALQLASFFETQSFSSQEARATLKALKSGLQQGDAGVVELLRLATKEISEVAETEGCRDLREYRGKLTKAFRNARKVLSENGAAHAADSVDAFEHHNVRMILSLAEKVSEVPAEQRNDPSALYTAIKDIKVSAPGRAPKPSAP